MVPDVLVYQYYKLKIIKKEDIEMDEMFSYIFGTLHYTEKSVNIIKKILTNQARFNRRVAAFALLCAAYTMAMEARIKEQDKKYEKLNKEVEEMKRTKGV